MVGSQEIILSIDEISRAFHSKSFSCEVRNRLSNGTLTTSTTNVKSKTEELLKNHNYSLIILYHS